MNGVEISPLGIKAQFDNYNTDAELTELEKEALKYIKAYFVENGADFDSLRFCRRSENYLSVIAPTDTDFCRLKVSERSVWYSVHGARLSEPLRNDSRFDGVKKSLLHWKVKLKSPADFKDNSDLILESYLVTINQK